MSAAPTLSQAATYLDRTGSTRALPSRSCDGGRATGLAQLFPPASLPSATGVWIVLNDAKKGQKVGTNKKGVREWISALNYVNSYSEIETTANGKTTWGKRNMTNFPGTGKMDLGKWYLDEYFGRATDTDAVPKVKLGGAFVDFEAWSSVPFGIDQTAKSMPAGVSQVAYVEQAAYAVAIIGVCKKEMLEKPLAQLYYTVTSIYEQDVPANRAGQWKPVSVWIRVQQGSLAGAVGDWSKLPPKPGSPCRINLVPVKDFTD